MVEYVDLSSSSDEGPEDSDYSGNQPANETADGKEKAPASEPSPKLLRKGRRKQPLVDEHSKFLANFDPGSSQREMRKMARSLPPPTAKPPTSTAIEKVTGRNGRKDLCDCLSEACAGCHLPCHSCGSGKCGQVCRKNRKWMYEEIYMDAKGDRIRNPLLAKQTKK